MSTQLTTSEWDIPPKRAEGETIEERFLDNVINRILPGRYLNKDENGNVIEKPEELFERVAKNIALAEVVYESEKLGSTVWVTPEDIKPDHPRRGQLAAKVFGFDGRKSESIEDVPEDVEEAKEILIDSTVELTEENVSKFAYDTVMGRIENEEVEKHVKKIKNEFQEMMEHQRWMPNSPTLMNAGAELQQLSACFVISPEDDIKDIYNNQTDAAAIFQSGGGCGYAFSDLRPYGDTVGSTGGIASGPITFMRSYDTMCETIAQGGTRRGAQMGVMRITHPDIIQFIHAKNKDVSLAHCLKLNDPDDHTHNSVAEAIDEARELITEDGEIPRHLRNAAEGHLSNFNISVGATNDFMEAAINEEQYTLINPRTGEPHIATQKTKELYERFDLGDEVTVGEELKLPAREILQRVVEGSHENGEPGLLLLDRANNDHSFPVESSPGPEHSKHEILASNPCGEQFLEEEEACNLGHINLSTIIAKEIEYEGEIYTETDNQDSEPTEQDFRVWHERKIENGYNGEKDDPEHIKEFLDQAINWDEFNHRIDLGTRFLENVCTMSDFPVDEIEKTVQENRKIGLGIMGLAQMFVQLGVKYGTPVSNEITKQVMIYINRRAKAESRKIAVNQERGSFENHDESKYANPTEYREWFEHQTGESADDWEDGYPIRNHNVTTIAPTGTTSLIGNTTGGCEPIYSVVNLRNIADDQGERIVEMDDYFIKVLEENGIDSDEVKQEALDQIDNNEYSGIEGLTTVPDELGDLFITTEELTPSQHVDIQCAAQKGVDSSISKTINAPHSATVEDIMKVFIRVYKKGGKGVTVYRDGTRNKQVKSTRSKNKEFSDMEDEEAIEVITEQINEAFDSLGDFLKSEEIQEELNGKAEGVIKSLEGEYLPTGFATKRPRPDTLYGHTTKIQTGYGKVYITLNEDGNGNLFEVWCRIGQSGGLTNSWTEALGKIVSTAIRCGVEVDEIINALKGTRSPKVDWDNGDRIDSIPDAIATVLQRHQNNEIGGIEGQQQITDITETENGKQEDGVKIEMQDRKVKQEGDERTGNKGDDLIAAGESPECPECGNLSLHYSEGCKTCDSCGWSEC